MEMKLQALYNVSDTCFFFQLPGKPNNVKTGKYYFTNVCSQ